MVTHNITLNVKQQGPIDTGIEVTQGDYGQVRLVMRVKDDDSYITNATGAEIVFSIPNGYFVVGNVTVSSGTYTYIFAGNELQCPGKIAATLTLKFADGRVSSCTFTFECRYNPAYDRRIQAGPYVAELEKLKQQAQEQVEYLETLIEQLQGDFDATVLTRADLVNNGLAANAGIAALDAVQANPNIKDTLAYKIDRLNSNLKNTLYIGTYDQTFINIDFRNLNDSIYSDKIPVFMFGTNNSTALILLILVSFANTESGSRIITSVKICNVANENGSTITVTISDLKTYFTINGLGNWGYFCFIAPPGIYIR